MPTNAQRCQQEVERLHTSFTKWFNATLPNTDQTFHTHISSALPNNFTFIPPSGTKLSQPNISSWLRSMHGSSHKQITIQNCQLVWEHDGTFLVCYEEWQRTVGKTTTTGDAQTGDTDGEKDKDVVEETARISTALLKDVPPGEETPNGLVWIHVHETWMPGKAPKSQ